MQMTHTELVFALIRRLQKQLQKDAPEWNESRLKIGRAGGLEALVYEKVDFYVSMGTF